MRKIIKNYEEARPNIIEALNLLADPVVQTLSPQGGNVMFEDEHGNVLVTNDGVTIAKQISSEDPLTDRIIDSIRHAALRTNTEAGDGTTTATVLTKAAVLAGMRMLDNGTTRLELKEALQKVQKDLLESLEELKIEVTTDQQLYQIAYVSSGGDDEVAKNVVEIVRAAGQDGLVMIEDSIKPNTVVKVEPGFLLRQPVTYQELFQNNGFTTTLNEVPVLITDKRLYYEEEAETILRTALEAGHKKLVVVAADFIGKTPNFFLANHQQRVIELILVKEGDREVLSDLAMYLGGELVTEKNGSLVNNLSPDQFVIAEKVFGNARQVTFNSKNTDNERVKERIKQIKAEIDTLEESEPLKKRLASLTNGTATVKVGGHTPVEVQERVFRYDDAIRAARAAAKDGYVVGGGLTLLKLLGNSRNDMMWNFLRDFCQAPVRQIAQNCGQYPDHVVGQCVNNYGYNARTGKFEDLLGAGVVDPYKVTQMAIANSLSVAQTLLTSNYFIVNEPDDE